MKRLSIIFGVVVCVCIAQKIHAVEVAGTDAPACLQQFDRTPTAERANRFLDALLQEGFLEEPLHMSEQAERDSICSVVWYWAAEYWYDRQDFAQASHYAELAISLCRKYGDKVLHADCASLLGLIYVRLGDFDRAAMYAKECNELDLQSGDANNIASSYNTLAGIYMSMRQTDEAEKYILRAMEYVKQAENPAREAVVYGMASEVYQHKNVPSKALEYATHAWELEKALDRREKAAIRQTQRAAALTVLERYDEAEGCLKDAIPVIELSGNSHSLAIAYNQMGDLLYVTGRNREGAEYYYKALPIFVSQHDIYNEAHTRKGLRETLRGIDPTAALEHGDRFEHLRDSIYDRETNANLSRFASEMENDILSQLNRKQRVRSAVTISLVCVIFAILALMTYIFHRRKQHEQRQHLEDLLNEVAHLRKKDEANVITAAPDQRADEIEDKLFLSRVVEYVNNALPDGDVSVEAIAKQLHMSSSTFRRRMAETSHSSPKTFIQYLRINKAKELLSATPPPFGGSIDRVAEACGYKETNSFIRAFTAIVGSTPAKWRENVRTSQQA